MDNKAWSTAISDVASDEVLLRGYPLSQVMERLTYTEGALLTIRGELPEPNERRMLDVLLCSLLDHGFVAASVIAARFIASGNPTLNAAVAGGILTAGSNTISPVHTAAFIRRASALCDAGRSDSAVAEEVVEEMLVARRRIPGLGHPTYKGDDPRAVVLHRIAKETGFDGRHARLFETIHARFVNVTGKSGVGINVDGRMACIMLDMGMDDDEMLAIAIMSVLPGIVAHSIEEMRSGSPLRVLDGEQYGYVGPPSRDLDGEVGTKVEAR